MAFAHWPGVAAIFARTDTDGRKERGTVVHVIDGLGRGGAERLLSLYAPELVRQGHRVEVVVLQERDGNPEAARLAAEGIAVHLAPLRKLRNLGEMRRVIDRIGALRPTVIHAHLEAATLVAGLARWRLGIPAIATLHTLERPDGLNRHSLRLWLMQRVLSNAHDRVICLSPAIRDIAARHGLGRAPLVALANGIPLPAADLPARGMRQSFGIPTGVPLIATVAVLRPPKGIDILVAAMPAIRAAVPDARLLIVGDGSERARLEEMAARPDLAGAVSFAGYRDDVADILREADLFVLPTLWDALPTMVIEAMAASLPVVASRVGGLPDMLRDGIEGALVEAGRPDALAAAIIPILRDPVLRAAMGKAARLRAEQEFSLQGQVGRLAALYDEVAMSGGSA